MALRINEGRFREMSASPDGPIGRHLRRVGERCTIVAKQIATNENHVRSGKYRDSINWKLLSDGSGLYVKFGSPLGVARLLERGSRPHHILARRGSVNFVGNLTTQHQAGGLWWVEKPNTGDRNWVLPEYPLQEVNHPGNKPYRILGRAVEQVLRGVNSTPAI